MKKSYYENNKGFSLIELIVIMAIVSVAIGALSLSVSLVTGSEAKKAFQKIEAQLDEVKTGAMSRYDESMKVQYFTKDETNGRDSDGFYVVKEIKTITTGSGSTPVGERIIGSEQRRICDSRVEITLTTSSGAVTLNPDGSNNFVISYDRATGLFKSAKVDGTDVGVPTRLECKSGLRTYKMDFIEETGKHVRVE